MVDPRHRMAGVVALCRRRGSEGGPARRRVQYGGPMPERSWMRRVPGSCRVRLSLLSRLEPSGSLRAHGPSDRGMVRVELGRRPFLQLCFCSPLAGRSHLVLRGSDALSPTPQMYDLGRARLFPLHDAERRRRLRARCRAVVRIGSVPNAGGLLVVRPNSPTDA